MTASKYIHAVVSARACTCMVRLERAEELLDVGVDRSGLPVGIDGAHLALLAVVVQHQLGLLLERAEALPDALQVVVSTTCSPTARPSVARIA